MGDETPGWVDDGSLRWAPDPAQAFVPDAPAPAGPWAATQSVTPAVEPAIINIAQLWPWRIALGLGQGLLFFALFHTRMLGVWPGGDAYLFHALTLAGLFVPLLLLEGVGTLAPSRLLPFAGMAAGLLAGLGWYHHWRIDGSETAHAGLTLIGLCALALFIVQAALHGRERGSRWRMPYTELFVASWILAARLLVWGWVTMLALLTLQVIGLSPERGQPVAVLLLALASALGFQLSAALPRFTSALADILAVIATALLPLAAAAGLLVVSVSLAHGPAPLIILLAVMTALLVTINASHRGDEDRGPWRDGAEVFGAVLLLILSGMALWSLDARVIELGWTPGRIFAAVAVALFAAYGAGYCASALLFLLRGHGLSRLQGVNRIMAAMVVLGCAALVSPLADPLRLSTAAQAARLEDGRIAPETFDFEQLERDGARFGREALASLSLSLYPDIARAARAVHGPIIDPQNPDEIGPNIVPRTPGAVLPATLLARDWTPVLGAPACLTRATATCDAHTLDLNHDGQAEILLVTGNDASWWAAVLQADAAGRWSLAGRLTSGCGVTRADLGAGRTGLMAALPGWNELSLTGARLQPGTACTH